MLAPLPKSEKKIISFSQNQIYLLKKIKPQNIIGIVTNSFATCGSLILSFDHDTYVIFTHFDETFHLIDELNKKFNEIKWQEIKNINVFYSEGKGPLFNEPLKKRNYKKY